MRTPELYIDDLHKMQVFAGSKSIAWMLIREECHKKGLKVPEIYQVRLKVNNKLTTSNE